MRSTTTIWRCSLALVILLLQSNEFDLGNAKVRQLYFSLMVSSAAGLNTSGVVPAVERALQDINNDSTILPGYSIHYTRVVDTKVMCT